MPGRPIIVDSGALYALFDRDDHHHREVRLWFAGNRRPLITNAAVITEVTYLLGRWCGLDHQLLFLEFLVRPGWHIESVAIDLPRIGALITKYSDLPSDFADASLLALAERIECTDIASTDRRDFSIYRPGHIERMNNVLDQFGH